MSICGPRWEDDPETSRTDSHRGARDLAGVFSSYSFRLIGLRTPYLRIYSILQYPSRGVDQEIDLSDK